MYRLRIDIKTTSFYSGEIADIAHAVNACKYLQQWTKERVKIESWHTHINGGHGWWQEIL